MKPAIGIDGEDPLTRRQIGNVGAFEVNSQSQLRLSLVERLTCSEKAMITAKLC